MNSEKKKIRLKTNNYVTLQNYESVKSAVVNIWNMSEDLPKKCVKNSLQML